MNWDLNEISEILNLHINEDFFCQISIDSFKKFALQMNWDQTSVLFKNIIDQLIQMKIIYIEKDEDDEIWEYLEIKNFRKFLKDLIENNYHNFFHHDILIDDSRSTKTIDKLTSQNEIKGEKDSDNTKKNIFDDIFSSNSLKEDNNDWLNFETKENEQEKEIIGEALWKNESSFVEVAIIPDYLDLIYVENFEELIEFIKKYIWGIYPYFNLEEVMYFLRHNVFLYDNLEKLAKTKECLLHWANRNNLIIVEENCFSYVNFDENYNFINYRNNDFEVQHSSRWKKMKQTFTQGEYLWRQLISMT